MRSITWAAAIACGTSALMAQTATVEGTLSSFDVVNDTGKSVYGFEVQIDGAQTSDLYYTMPGQRYGNPVITQNTAGVSIRWSSPYDNVTRQYTKSTPPHAPGTPFSWNDCYIAGSRYTVSGCEHFGQSMRATPAGKITKVSGYWLTDDPAAPGTLIRVSPPAAIPFAMWSVAPVVTISVPPVVVAEVEAPEPPETPEVYGDAQWVKIYKSHLTRSVTADELTSDNTAVVPEDPSQIEVSWDILQASPPSGGNGNRNRNRKQNSGNIGADTRAVVRRYELYKYTGAYDALTHQAACADGLCNAPGPGELGDAISAQNTAANVLPDAITVVRTGNGNVAGANGKISCGNACVTFAPKGTVLSLTASPSGTVFTGWSGICGGTGRSCSFALSGQMTARATFKSQFTLSIGRSNPGTVRGTPNGNDRALDCGGACSAKFTDGTVVTLTATPPAGKAFVNWSGGCSGTNPVCQVTITRNTSVQAVFSK